MRKIYFRADADSIIGFGHFTRTLALAEMLKDEFDCTFFTQSPTEYQKEEVTKICPLVELPSDDNKFPLFLEKLQGNEIVFLDNYFFTSDYERKIKDKGCKLVVLSPADRHHFADVVINYVEEDISQYSVESYTKIYAGLQWSILRKPFTIPIGEHKRNSDEIVVSFGGTDSLHLIERVLDLLNEYNVNVICTSRVSSERILGFKEKGANVHVDIGSEKIAELFENSEWAILSCSTICLEAISRGCKVISGYYVDNQIEYYSLLKKRGLICGIGNICTKDALVSVLEILKNTYDGQKLLIDFTKQRSDYISIFSNLW